MAHRMHALAGYDETGLTHASDSVSHTAGSHTGFRGLPDATDTQLHPSPPAAARRPLAQANGVLATTPVRSARTAKPRRDSPPSTGHRQDRRRAYGVMLGGDDSTPRRARNADATALDEEPTHTMDSDMDFKQLTRQLWKNGDRPPHSNGSAEQTHTSHDQTSDQTPDATSWNARDLGRSAAAGTNLKQLERMIEDLTSQRDDLKIEVDFYRRKGSDVENANELIQLRQEKAKHLREIISYRDMLREQNKALKRNQQSLQGKDPKDLLRLEEESKRLRKLTADQENDIAQLKEELDALQQSSEEQLRQARDSGDFEEQLRERIAEAKQEYEEDMYRLEIERDQLANQLEAAEAKAHDTSRASDAVHQKDDLIESLKEKLEDTQHNLEAARQERDEITAQRRHVEEQALIHQHSATELKANLEDTHQTLTQLQGDYNQYAEKMELDIQALEERLTSELQRARDEGTSWQLECDKKDSRLQELTNLVDELQAKAADQEYELRASLQDVDELEGKLVEVEREADMLDAKCKDLEQQLQQRDADLDAAGHDVDAAQEEIRLLTNKVYETEAERDAKQADVQALLVRAEEAEIALQTSHQRDETLRARINEAHACQAELEARIAELDALNQDSAARADAHEASAITAAEAHKGTKADLERAQKELAKTIESLRAQERSAAQASEEYEAELREREAEYRSALAERDEEIRGLESELDIRRDELEELKDDLHRMQNELQDQADQSVRDGHTFSSERQAFELRTDQLQRTVSTLERELQAATKAVERQADLVKERDSDGTKAKAEIRELAGKLSAEQQARLGLADRFEMQARALKNAQEEVDEARAKLEDLEAARADERRHKVQASEQTLRQLKERNTLLMNVYQRLARLVGTEKLSQRKKEEDTKPFTNFSIFHDSLLARLKRVGDLQIQFESRTREMESKMSERFAVLKRQQDAQARRTNQLETSVKTASDKQALWRNRVAAKQTELDAVRSAHNELQNQITSMKSAQRAASGRASSPNVSSSRITPAAERRLTVAQNQLAAAEDRMEETRARHETEEAKWKERVRALEAQLKQKPPRPSSSAPNNKDKDGSSSWSDYKAEIKNQLQRTRADMERAKSHSKKLDELLAAGPDESPSTPPGPPGGAMTAEPEPSAPPAATAPQASTKA